MKLLEIKTNGQLPGIQTLTLAWKESSEVDMLEGKLLPREEIWILIISNLES